MGEKNGKELYAKIIVNYILVIAGVILFIFVVPGLIKYMWPIVVGWIIAMIANPLVKFLERKLKVVRKHGTAIVIIFVLAMVIGIIYLLLYALIKEGISFGRNFPDIYASVSENIASMINNLRQNVTILPEKSRVLLDDVADNLGKYINDFVGRIIRDSRFTIGDASAVVKNVAEGLLMTVITILLSYFLTAEHENILEQYHKKMPESVKRGCFTIKKCVVSAFGGYFKAQFKIMCCVFTILMVGFLCMRIEYAILIAFIVSFVDFLPVFGAGAIMWPWCAYEVISGRYVTAVVLFIFYLICQVVRQVLQPKMVGDSIGISPLSTLIFMFFGYRIAGVIGMIIGIPVGMVLTSFYKEGVFDNLIRGTRILVNSFNKWRKF
mgnify:FL=1